MEIKLEDAIKEALLKRAQGYEYEEKTVTGGRDGKPDKVKVVVKHVPPDMKAIEKIEYYKALGWW